MLIGEINLNAWKLRTTKQPSSSEWNEMEREFLEMNIRRNDTRRSKYQQKQITGGGCDEAEKTEKVI